VKRHWLRARVVVAALSAIAVSATGHAAALAQDWRVAAQAEIDNFVDQYPTDYTGIDRLLVKYGLPPMKVRISGIDRELTSAEAEAELAAWEAAEAKVPGAGISAVPTDAFTVAMTLNYDLYLNRVVTGSWNFRDNYVNGSDPDDVATVQANLAGNCFRTGTLVRKAADYAGADYTGQTYVEDGGVNGSPIFGIRDRASGFRLLTDNGYFRVTYNKTGASGCGSAQLGAQFQYEKNQDGSSGFSASAGWGFFSVSYSGAPAKLRKSTSASYL
jgi:hypothetical protein